MREDVKVKAMLWVMQTDFYVAEAEIHHRVVQNYFCFMTRQIFNVSWP